MRKRVLIATAIVAVLGIAATAFAAKFSSTVTANTTDDEDRIYGVVQSGDFACEKRREVRLYGRPVFFTGKKRGIFFDYERLDETHANRFGEYSFNTFVKAKRGKFPEEFEFFVRALRKDFPGNVCQRADSESVFVEFEF